MTKNIFPNSYWQEETEKHGLKFTLTYYGDDKFKLDIGSGSTVVNSGIISSQQVHEIGQAIDFPIYAREMAELYGEEIEPETTRF